jgi:hypothetical protein
MSENLQAAEPATNEPVLQADESVANDAVTHESGADSDTATGDNQSTKIEFSEDQQRHFNDVVGKKTFKAKQAEREAEKLRAELAEVKKQIPQAQKPEVPSIPSQYDYDTDEQYQSAVRGRDGKIQELARYEEQDRFRNAMHQNQQAQEQRAAEERVATAVQSFQDNAKRHGIDEAELNQAIEKVNMYGISQELGMHIMDRADGGLIAKHLANNPQDLELLTSVSPLQAAVLVETQIAAKANALKPKVTNAPDPVETLNGTGVPAKKRGPPGATYS